MSLEELGLLRAFDVGGEEIGKLSSFLEKAASVGWTRFNPALFARLSDIDQLRATELLLMSAEELHLLQANFEVECPLCSQSHFTVRDPSELPGEDKYCATVDELYTPDPSLIWITFDLTEPLTRKKKLPSP